ncbi:MAG: acyl-CoA synthetase [Lentisphaerae bacterium RIFOXYC12_FULL_60_16]|nr:MAG: acyl-CoA synthetase [Lentisphaerae bacterium RIFOXYC12_FULL_60_16]OGV74392.1 MAG: acyl-CoA synthetase [Lentisphaerae bacterium RIFOXYA12_FULL_60_10]
MLSHLLRPQAVAVIGASRSPGKVGHELVANLQSSGYAGTIVPVNPSARDVLGIPCYPDLNAFQGTIDLAIIAVPTPLVKASVESAMDKGAKAIVVITAGFKEIGKEGAALEREIAGLCKARGVRLLGPNCLGLINTHHHMNASFAKKMPKQGGISVISQSGALCTAILDWAAGRHLGLSKLISMGNKADLSETDFLTSFADDPETRVIVGYLESIVSGDRFIKAAELASSHKPLVIFKAGVTQAGVKAASSHTGSLAGADIAYGAAFKRSGVIRAETFEALFDYAVAFAMQPLPKGDRVAIITNAGGPGIMAADAVEASGMHVSTLASGTATALREKLPAAASVNNPIDVLGDADPDRYVMAVNAAQNDDSVDAIIVILTPQAMTKPAETARAIAACTRGEKPILASFMGGEDVMPGRDELVQSNLPDYTSPERAVAALHAMWEYASWLKRPPRVITRFPVNRRRVQRILHRHQRLKQFQVGEAAAKEILLAYDFTVPSGDVATTVEEAQELVAKIGFPVAMKIVSPDIIHKSDVGGVRLNLDSTAAVQDAFDLMMLRIQQRLPQARIHGVYIEKMCRRGREVILGMTRDPQFGPMLMFGLGGIFVEVMKDVTFHIAPITEVEAMQMLESTKSFALLKGTRGQASVDLSAIAISLQRISQLVSDFPQIMEMDINPFIVGEVGGESIAADARITLSKGDSAHE